MYTMKVSLLWYMINIDKIFAECHSLIEQLFQVVDMPPWRVNNLNYEVIPCMLVFPQDVGQYVQHYALKAL